MQRSAKLAMLFGRRSRRLVFDDFTGADNASSLSGRIAPTSQAWAITGDAYGVISNKAYRSAGAATWNLASVDAGAANVRCEADITHGPATLCAGLVVRATDVNNFVIALLRNDSINTNSVFLYKQVATVFTQLGSTGSLTLTPGQTYKLKVTAVGPALNVYVNGVSMCSAIDGVFSSVTRCGLVSLLGGFDDGGTRWDNFTVSTP